MTFVTSIVHAKICASVEVVAGLKICLYGCRDGPRSAASTRFRKLMPASGRTGIQDAGVTKWLVW
jgi:hypothetical protein